MPFPITSWLRAFFALEECAIDSHGAVQLTSGDDSVVRWPRTCGADVAAIAAIFDTHVRLEPLRFGGHGLGRQWRACIDALASATPSGEHADNRTFWRTLPPLCVYLHARGAPVPPADVWQALLARLRDCPAAKERSCLIR